MKLGRGLKIAEFVFDAGEDVAAEAVGEGAGFFVVALGLAAEGGVAATPGAPPAHHTYLDTANASRRPYANSQNSRRDTGLSYEGPLQNLPRESDFMNIILPPESSKDRRVIFVETGIGEITDWGWGVENTTSSTLRFLRAHKMTSPLSMFDEVSAALQFPYYFGENWDALDECLSDLQWLVGDMMILVITETERLLQNPAHFRDLIAMLVQAAEEHQQKNRSLVTIIHCSPSHGDEVKNILKESSIELAHFHLK